MTTDTRFAGTAATSTTPLWRPRLLTVVGAAVGAAVLFFIGKAADVALTVDQNDGKGAVDLTIGNVIGFAAGAALLGWALLALLEKFAPAKSKKIWTIVASVVLVVSLGLPFGVETTSGTKVILALTHLTVGLVVILGLRRNAKSA